MIGRKRAADPTETKAKPRVRKRTPRPGRGTLVIISSLLIGSAFIRLGGDAGRAIAEQIAAQDAGHEMTDGDHSPGATAKSDCTPPADIAAMLAAFKAREDALQAREAKMKSRMKALELVDQKISERMAELKSAESELRGTLALADSAAENDIARLTSVYQSMKPKDAAALFEQMDPTFSAGFLGRMEPGAAAQIMAGLTPATAYTISAILAGRNANVPTE